MARIQLKLPETLPRLKLPAQLLVVSITFLGLPWTGCEFLRANEQALQTLQRQGLEATGRAISDSLRSQVTLLYAEPSRAVAPLTPQSLLVQPSISEPVLDGAFDEWEGISTRSFGDARQPLYVSATRVDDALFLAITAIDSSKQYNSNPPTEEPAGDRLIITTWPGDRRQEYVIATAAPGKVRSRVVGRRLRGVREGAIRGYWADRSFGYQIELTLPISAASARLGIQYLDSDQGGVSTRGNTDALSTQAPPWLVDSTSAMDSWIENHNRRDYRVEVYDRWGWPLARSQDLQTAPTPSVHGLVKWFYRRVLNRPTPDPAPVTSADGRVSSDAMSEAIRGLSGHELVEIDNRLLSRFVAPIQSDRGVIGLVVVEQPRERYLSLTDSAFAGLLGKGIFSAAIALAALLGFVLFTGWRIRRLDTEVVAIRAGGAGQLSMSRLDDELDDLTRQFNQLLEHQEQEQARLEVFPSTLTHEIRTPLAMIRGSLEELEKSIIYTKKTRELRTRAHTGLDRLASLVTAMSETHRLESVIAAEAFETVDLVTLLQELSDAYGQTYPDWKFAFLTENRQAEAAIAPDLIVQALDKLVANATSFTRPGQLIQLDLEKRGLWWRVSVTNPGPTLSEDQDTASLFSPLISAREADPNPASHLGLGLYVVRLIAEHHGGEPFLRNRESNDGVVAGFSIRAAGSD